MEEMIVRSPTSRNRRRRGTRSMYGVIAFAMLLAMCIGMSGAHADDDDDDDGPRGFRIPSFGRLAPFIGNLRPGHPRRSRVEMVVVGLDEEKRREIERRGFRISATAYSALLGDEIARVEAPAGQSLRRALRTVRTFAGNVTAEPNDLYRRHAFSRYRTAGQLCGERCEAFALTSWLPSLMRCSVEPTIGVVDTQVDATHQSLLGAKLTTKSLRRADRRPSDPAHGTGVVSLLVGQPDTAVIGIVPAARVLAADAFHRARQGDTADTFDLIASLDWLADGGVQIINMSLSGPDNPAVEKAIGATLARGIAVVAAVGRPEGRSTGYPARYDGVLAVSAVDMLLRPSRLSMRGSHVAFAAPGVGLTVAGARGALTRVDGTSFAAPFVTAALALQMGRGRSPGDAAQAVTTTAKDLGAPGRDPVFGWGLVQYANIPDCGG
jgi:hypothetical protein